MIEVLVNTTVFISPVLAILYLIGFIKFDKAYKSFCAYLVAMSVIQLTSEYIILTKAGSNLFLSHYYLVLQFILLSLFFFYLLKKKWVLWVLGGGCLFLGYQYISDPSLYHRYNGTGIAISQLILVGYSLLYLFKSLSQKSSFVIVNVGFLVYLLSSIVIFASTNFFLNSDTNTTFARLLNSLNAILYFVFQLLIFVEWWRNYRPRNG